MRKGLIVSLLLGGCLFYSAAAESPESPEIIAVCSTPEITARLQGLDLDLLMSREGRLFFVIDRDRLSELSEAGIPFTLETTRFAPAFPGHDDSLPPITQGGINGDFHSYAETESALQALAEAHPDIVRLEVIGLSLEGRNITAVKISDFAAADENEAEILFLGCHHAREWISVEVPLLLAEELAGGYATDPKVRGLVDNAEIWIVPLVNPDGLEYSIHYYRYWRKNRRDNGNGTYGVDPNRNYGYMWGLDNEGSNSNPSSLTYRGAGPFSEPESRAVRDLMESRNFSVLASYHNYSQVILYPWGYTDQASPMDDLLHDMAAEMSARMQAVHGTFYDFGRGGADLYVSNGGTTDWALGVLGIPAFTIELPPVDVASGGFFNAEESIRPIFEENRAAAYYLIEWSVSGQSEESGSRQPGKISKRKIPKKTLR